MVAEEAGVEAEGALHPTEQALLRRPLKIIPSTFDQVSKPQIMR